MKCTRIPYNSIIDKCNYNMQVLGERCSNTGSQFAIKWFNPKMELKPFKIILADLRNAASLEFCSLINISKISVFKKCFGKTAYPIAVLLENIETS
jgi:hypothetical protein